MFKQKKISVPIGSMGLHLEVLFCFFIVYALLLDGCSN
jgi:hypothetical protein